MQLSTRLQKKTNYTILFEGKCYWTDLIIQLRETVILRKMKTFFIIYSCIWASIVSILYLQESYMKNKLLYM